MLTRTLSTSTCGPPPRSHNPARYDPAITRQPTNNVNRGPRAAATRAAIGAIRQAGADALDELGSILTALRDEQTMISHHILDSLTPREAKVLRMRFGIDMNTDHTLEEVGKQFDVTRERIRQIEAKALRKLRHPSRSEVLRSFLDD